MAENMNQSAIDEISTLVGHADELIAYGGGGRGQTAYIEGIGTPTDEAPLGFIEGKGSSRYAALVDLLEKVRAWAADRAALSAAAIADINRQVAESGAQTVQEWIDEAQPKARATVDEAIEAIRTQFPELDINEEDDNRTPGPVWQDRGGMPFLVAIVPCVGECMMGKSDVCDCRCGGSNHGLMNMAGMSDLLTWDTVRSWKPVPFGPKECLCGCGAITDRKFVPGHDARFHAAQKRHADMIARGLQPDSPADQELYAEYLKQVGRDKSKARRIARRDRRAAAV